jgi:hypothetical protein
MTHPPDRPEDGSDIDRRKRRWPQVLMVVGFGLLLALIIVGHLLGGFRGPH